MRRSALVMIFLGACAGPRSTAVPAPNPAPPVAPPAPAAVAAPAPPPPSAIPSTWDVRKQAPHVLERLAYGPRPGDVNALAASGIDAWLARQLAPSTINDDVAEAKLRELPTLALSIPELHAKYPRVNGKKAANAAAAANAGEPMEDAPMPQAPVAPTAPGANGGIPDPAGDHRPVEMERELAVQKLIRAIDSERQLQEVLVDFWFNHFNVYADKGADRWLVGPYERDAIRPHVLGRFRDLLGAVAHHPAMLYYLDNWLSAADGFVPGAGGGKGQAQAKPNKGPSGLNENYGRELLELHTLGVDGGYSQDDVRNTARAFTGWSIEKPQEEGAYVFRKRRHDDGAKTILGKTLPAGGGEADGEAVLDLVASHPATAKFIARKLCVKFVADDPPASVVDHVADVFTRSSGDLKATYEALFLSPEFWSDAADGTKTKTPLEVAASAARAIGATVTVETDLPRWVARMGEPLYRAQPPTGYKETADAWVSTGALVARIDFGIALAAGRVRGVSFDREKVFGASVPEDPVALVVRLGSIVVPRPLAAATWDTIASQLRAGSHGISYEEPSPSQLPQALGLLLGSPEFQKQ